MNTEGAALHAVRAADHLTAADAVTWFARDTPPRRQVIGYTMSARAATWLRVGPDGAVQTVHATGDVLAEAYEMVLFDGERELRWLRALDGRGPAIALGEDRAGLPPGQCVTADPPPRWFCTHRRLLAGDPARHDTADWTPLHSKRYASTHLPVACAAGKVLTIETVEYVTEDEHGNLDVTDTRILGLRPTTPAAVQVMAAGPAIGQEGTTA